jgi:hypothetical protein
MAIDEQPPFAIGEVYNADPRCNDLEQAANGRLIAAAPDLLIALKSLVAAAGEPMTDELDAARAAIAQAEGKEPTNAN